MNQQQKVAATIAASAAIAVVEMVMTSRIQKKADKSYIWMRRASEIIRLQDKLITWVEEEGPFQTKEEILKKVKEDNEYIQFVAAH